MSIHLQRDLESLENKMLTMCSLVAGVVHEGVAALEHPDTEHTRKMILHDDDIDECDVNIEDSCLKILALHQPVAADLRHIATAMKIGGELERIADLGVNIAERAAALVQLPAMTVSPKLSSMSRMAMQMVDDALAAYVNKDVITARRICALDSQVDELNRQIIAELTEVMQKEPQLVPPAMHLFSACRHIERIGDHATNIAEDVIYLVEGDIVRHRDTLRRATA
jgi:phosphate transport system protein